MKKEVKVAAKKQIQCLSYLAQLKKIDMSREQFREALNESGFIPKEWTQGEIDMISFDFGDGCTCAHFRAFD